MLDWIPRKILADEEHLAGAPDVCSVRPGRILAAVDALEPEYQELIHTERPQGPAALMTHFGVTGSVSQRSGPLLRAIGVEPDNGYVVMDLGTPRYLTSGRRAAIVDDRDRFRAMAE